MELEPDARRLHEIGLNAYESSAYLVLLGHSQFKAHDVASRANIPRAKIYDVLSRLIEQGFVRVVQGKTKQFSAVEPRLALDGYLRRRRESFLREWEDRRQLAKNLGADLATAFQSGANGRSPLNYIRIVADKSQVVQEYRQMLLQTRNEYLEFARPPYAVDPIGEPTIRGLAENGIACRLLFDSAEVLDPEWKDKLARLEDVGARVRLGRNIPVKLALFDSHSGMISLDDPFSSELNITALVFEHRSLASAMRTLFADFWNRSWTLDDVPPRNSS